MVGSEFASALDKSRTKRTVRMLSSWCGERAVWCFAACSPRRDRCWHRSLPCVGAPVRVAKTRIGQSRCGSGRWRVSTAAGHAHRSFQGRQLRAGLFRCQRRPRWALHEAHKGRNPQRGKRVFWGADLRASAFMPTSFYRTRQRDRMVQSFARAVSASARCTRVLSRGGVLQTSSRMGDTATRRSLRGTHASKRGFAPDARREHTSRSSSGDGESLMVVNSRSAGRREGVACQAVRERPARQTGRVESLDKDRSPPWQSLQPWSGLPFKTK